MSQRAHTRVAGEPGQATRCERFIRVSHRLRGCWAPDRSDKVGAISKGLPTGRKDSPGRSSHGSPVSRKDMGAAEGGWGRAPH